ncbi:hypothetical protein Tco_1571276 [Tanacetum coccineum]
MFHHTLLKLSLDSGLLSNGQLIENLTNALCLAPPKSYKTYLPQTNNQLRTSSNPRNQATVQDERVVVQIVQVKQGRWTSTMLIKMFWWYEQPVQDVALNWIMCIKLMDCDALFDSDVDEAPIAQTMFMANLSSVDPVYDEAGPSYDSDILSEVHDHDQYQDVVCEHHEEHEMHDDVQPNYVVDSHADYTSDSNMILYDQYVKDNAVPVEQVELYERRARFELTEREQKIDEQLRIVITDRNIKEENLKKELHSVKLQLASTINHNKSMVEEVTSLKKDFKQKENKYLEEFLDMKALKEKVEDKLYKQDQSLQTVHMLCKPKPYYDELNKLNVSSFTEMHDAHTSLKARCLELEVELSNLRDKIQKDNHDELIKWFSNLEGVNSCTDSIESQFLEQYKKNRILRAKSVNMKKVEEHPRIIKSSLKTIECSLHIVPLVFGGQASSKTYDGGNRSKLRNFHEKFIGKGTVPTFLTHGQISSGFVPNPVPAAPYVPPTNKDLEILFQPIFDEYLEPPRVKRNMFLLQSSSSSKSHRLHLHLLLDQDAPIQVIHVIFGYYILQLTSGFVAESTLMEDNPFAPTDKSDPS